MLKEFRDFAMRGNVIDLAVGVIIGAAFGAIVSSLVADIIMPPIGVLLGGVDFSDFFINLSGQHFDTLADAKKASAATINYGVFINQVIKFIIIAVPGDQADEHADAPGEGRGEAGGTAGAAAAGAAAGRDPRPAEGALDLADQAGVRAAFHWAGTSA